MRVRVHSDRHVLGLLLCAGVNVLCRAVVCRARGSTTTYVLVRTTAVLVLLYTGAALQEGPLKKWKTKAQHC